MVILMKLLLGGYNHETNTFSLERTPLTSFQIRGDYAGMYIGEELITHFRGSRTVFGGAIDAADLDGQLQYSNEITQQHWK